MIIHDTNDNILISGASHSGGYQDGFENWELCIEVNNFKGLDQNPKNNSRTCAVHIS